VSHYVVEKKDKKSGVWTPVSRFCRSPSLDVTGLDEGEQYEFRVSAVNDLGQSEPLLTDKPIIAKHQFGTSALHWEGRFCQDWITQKTVDGFCRVAALWFKKKLNFGGGLSIFLWIMDYYLRLVTTKRWGVK